MNKAIVVGSYRNSPWLEGCLASIPCDISTIVVRNDGYELGAIKWAYQHTDLDEFLFLQDSTRIKRNEWLYDLFAKEGTSIALNGEPVWGGSYLAKFRREILDKMGEIPETKTKSDAIIYESVFMYKYEQMEPNRELLWPLMFSEPSSPKSKMFGREVIVLENEHFIKYKNCWATYMAEECQNRDRATSGNYQ